MKLFAAMAVAAPALLVAEKDIFSLPAYENARVQEISRVGDEANWPFSVNEGLLVCMWVLGQPMPYFVEKPEADTTDEQKEPRVLMLTSADPFALVFGNIAGQSLFAPAISIEERIKQVAPIAAMGRRLCDQPPGMHVGGGEL